MAVTKDMWIRALGLTNVPSLGALLSAGYALVKGKRHVDHVGFEGEESLKKFRCALARCLRVCLLSQKHFW
jgi:hypothetical protein